MCSLCRKILPFSFMRLSENFLPYRVRKPPTRRRNRMKYYKLFIRRRWFFHQNTLYLPVIDGRCATSLKFKHHNFYNRNNIYIYMSKYIPRDESCGNALHRTLVKSLNPIRFAVLLIYCCTWQGTDVPGEPTLASFTF